MAQQIATTDGTLIVPGAVARLKVQTNPSGLATNGVLIILGEAESGPSFVDEGTALSLNAFGPDQVADVQAKYGSGALVDAFRAASAASADQKVPGSFFRAILVKTNQGTIASGTLPAIGGGTYANLTAASAGTKGNLIARKTVASQAEVVPATPGLILAPPQASTVAAFRANGGAVVSTTLTTGELPSAMVTAIDALTGVAATGGVNRSVLTAATGSVTVVVDSGFQAHFTYTGTWSTTPTVGDILYLPTGSPFTTANEGTWVVTAATSNRVDAYKLLDAAGSGAGRTAPTGEGPIAIAATTDFAAFSPVVISLEAGVQTPGLGKSLEIANSGSTHVSDLAYLFSGANAVPPASAYTGISTSTAPTTLVATEYGVTLSVSRSLDHLSQSITVQGQVLLALGYTGTTATATITNGVLTTTVSGGTGTNLTIALADHPTIADLAAFIATQTGYVAVPATAAAGQRASTDLDPGTYGIATSQGAPNGRIKGDGALFSSTVAASLSSIVLTPVAPAVNPTGLPDVSASAFLTGATRGATTDTSILNALSACERVRGNFVIPCFSRDASLDITSGLTDPSSTYTIAAIHANTKTHVLTMSQVKRGRPRQAFLSFRGTFAQAQAAAQNLAEARCSCAFQDVVGTDSTGRIKQFQPWYAAALAAGFQAAAFYKPIFAKLVNVSGVLQAAGDYDDQLTSNEETALLAGLLPLRRREEGGFEFVSDQTTYTADSNFFFNSIQAVYSGDVIATSAQAAMQRVFVGESFADVSASLALSTFEQFLDGLRDLKLIVGDDDAPKGYKDVKVSITAPAITFSATVVEATGVYFVVINFLVVPFQAQASG